MKSRYQRIRVKKKPYCVPLGDSVCRRTKGEAYEESTQKLEIYSCVGTLYQKTVL